MNGCGIDKQVKETNPKDACATNRALLNLVPTTAQVYCALGMTEGHFKYGGYNFRKAGIRVMTYLDAIDRHLSKFKEGSWADPKTKVPHLANAIASLAILIDGMEQGNVEDDRPIKSPDVEDLFAWAEQVTAKLRTMYPNGPGLYTEQDYGYGVDMVDEDTCMLPDYEGD